MVKQTPRPKGIPPDSGSSESALANGEGNSMHQFAMGNRLLNEEAKVISLSLIRI